MITNTKHKSHSSSCRSKYYNIICNENIPDIAANSCFNQFTEKFIQIDTKKYRADNSTLPNPI